MSSEGVGSADKDKNSRYMPLNYGFSDKTEPSSPYVPPEEVPVQTPVDEVPRTFQPHTASLMAEGSLTPCVIKVIGIGGGGGNAVNRMVQTGIQVSSSEPRQSWCAIALQQID